MEAKKRFVFIDLLKGWAILVMIEVHVFNAFLHPSLKETFWFSVINFINGLVAPSFTFISGFAFIISSKSNLDEMRRFGPRFWKKLSRISFVIIIGYLLHIPSFSFRGIINYASPQSLLSWCNVDVLQCIGFSLLFLFISRLIIKSDKFYNNFILYAAIITIVISPFIWNIDFSKYMPMAFACYFNAVNGSYFPLFPWMGFVLSGAYACILYLKFRSQNKEQFFINRAMLYSGVLFAVTTVVIYFLEMNPAFQVKPNPFFFIQRLSMVLISLGLCWYYTTRFGERSSFVTDISRESLLVYFLHIQVIYRSVWFDHSLEKWINTSFGVREAIYATLLLIASMIAVAELWGKLKIRFPKTASIATRVFITVSVILFFVF